MFKRRQNVAAVVTDIVMPRLSGDAMARQLRELVPSLPIVYVSGYSDQFEPASLQPSRSLFLQKPFRPEQLLGALHSLLQSSSASGSS